MMSCLKCCGKKKTDAPDGVCENCDKIITDDERQHFRAIVEERRRLDASLALFGGGAKSLD